MNPAFQPGAFQDTGFQAPTPTTGSTAFQPGAFQFSGFQQQNTRAVETLSGGWHLSSRRHRTQEEIEQERIKLGIIPAPVQKAVQKVVKKAIAQAALQASPDEWLRQQQQALQAKLLAELRSRQQGYEAQYMRLVRLQIELALQQQEEDEQIVHLLMEM